MHDAITTEEVLTLSLVAICALYESAQWMAHRQPHIETNVKPVML
jgi:hypothetical protein